MPQVESKTFNSSKNGVPLVRLDYLTEKRIWVLSLLNEETKDNRLTHELIRDGVVAALREVRATWQKWVEEDTTDDGAALVTTAALDAKIWSNGLDLFTAIADPTFFNEYLNVMFLELLTFPIPTVASVGGHAFAAGFSLACAHDYRVQNGKRGYMCLNEIEFGAPIPSGMMASMRSATVSFESLRKCVLEGYRFDARDAVAYGFADVIAEGDGYDGPQGTLKRSLELAESLRSRCVKNAWQTNKEVLYQDLIAVMKRPDAQSKL
ncbi:hypothetical protein MSPP1_002211 [Malassezia sp. CBS 17886]|nr:hypothetical protein MSPP1_002211 [Malassezia sp. CBS 17886]